MNKQKSDKRYRVRKQLKAEGKSKEEINQVLEANPETSKSLETQNDPIISNSEIESQNQSEEIQIEDHTADPGEGFKGLLSRATASLKNTLTDDDKPKRGRPSKTNKQEFSTLVVSVLTLVVTFIKVDERVKPNNTEIATLSDHLSNIMLRHLPINNALSADAIDVIGIFAVSALWYQRVSVDLPRLKPGNEEAPQEIPYKSNGNQKLSPEELQSFSPEDAAFLDSAAQKYRDIDNG